MASEKKKEGTLAKLRGPSKKVAIVTGGCGGIGSAVCRYLADDGMHVVVVDLDQSQCEKMAASLSTKSMGLSINICDEKAVAEGVKKVLDQFGTVNVLVNVAGILSNNKIQETSTSEWNKVMAVNVTGTFLMTKYVVPHMIEHKWGRIVNLSSWAWKSGGLTAGTVYTTSKGAVTSLTFSVARQYADKGITCNAIAPCYVMSKMVSEQLTAKQRAELLEKIPVHRFCEPEEIAHCTRFLCHDMSGFITGEVLDVNAGFQMD
jgi:3-oxoacyl-[acyl-carrier protein] reductase